MIARTEVTGSILAGGRSLRMGQDKALLLHEGRPFIKHIADTLSGVVDQVSIIADKAEAYEFLRLRVYADIFTNSGPLAGIHSALSHSPNPYVFIASCDAPFISVDTVLTILRNALPGEITIANDGLNTLPLVGIYPTSLLQEFNEKLSTGEKRVNTFLEASSAHVSVVALPEFKHNLRNINTPEEYAEISRV